MRRINFTSSASVLEQARQQKCEQERQQEWQQTRRQSLRQLGQWLACAGLLSSSPAALATRPAARRLVSVGGALTEIVYALDAAADLVGVDTTSLFPAAAQKLPNVGYARALSAEGVLALAPSQIIATEDAGPPAVMRQLAASGIPLAVLAANHRFEGLLERVKRIGEITARPSQASALMQTLQGDWQRTQLQVAANGAKVRVLFILAHTPNQIMVAGAQTSAQAMLEYVGASNAIHQFTGYKPLTPEAVIAAQPELVLLTEQGLKTAGGVAGILRLPGLAQTPAGRNKRVLAQEAMFLLGFGPRLPAAVATLHQAIAQVMRT